MALDMELGEDEQMKSQPSRDAKLFLYQSHSLGDIEVTQEQPHQLEGIGKHDVVTQEPTSSIFFVEVSFQLE